jgi:hypothetical protein
MTTIDHSGPDADDLAARSRANDTLSSLIEASPPDLSDTERFEAATRTYGTAMATAANNLARQRLLAAYGPLGDIQNVKLLEP